MDPCKDACLSFMAKKATNGLCIHAQGPKARESQNTCNILISKDNRRTDVFKLYQENGSFCYLY